MSRYVVQIFPLHEYVELITEFCNLYDTTLVLGGNPDVKTHVLRGFDMFYFDGSWKSSHKWITAYLHTNSFNGAECILSMLQSTLVEVPRQIEFINNSKYNTEDKFRYIGKVLNG